jgi:hypothetical protein
MLKLGLASLFSMTVVAAATAPGCSTIDRIYDCNVICDRYKDCVDANYDDDACAERCQDEAADSEAYQDRADSCQACIDDRSCTGAVFNCASECAGIVP